MVIVLRVIALLLLAGGIAAAFGEASYPHTIDMAEGWSCTSEDPKNPPLLQGLLLGADLSAIACVVAGSLSAAVLAALGEIVAQISARDQQASDRMVGGVVPGTPFRFLAAPTRAVPRLIFLRVLQGIAALTAVSGLIAAAGQAYYQHPWFYVRGWLCSSPDAHNGLDFFRGRSSGRSAMSPLGCCRPRSLRHWLTLSRESPTARLC